MKRVAGIATFLIAVFLHVGAGPAFAQTPAGASTTSTVDKLLRPALRIAGQPDTAFNLLDRMRYWHVPGVSIAIVEDFKIVYARGFGVTQFGGSTLVDTTTLFQAGSISKPVFATGALRLVEQRKLALDEDVNVRLKSWRMPDSRHTAREKVTLQRLLTHSAGLTVWGFPGYDADSALPTVPQVLDGARPANTSAVRNDTIPGARWLYSGGGFTIAQLLASDVAGEPFPALMRRLVLLPSGMTRSTYENPLPLARHREAASGHERIDTPVHGRFHTYPEMAAAGLWTTAPELARWALELTRAYNGESNAVLSQTMARQMISRQVQVGAQYGGGYYGLGVAVDGEDDSISFSHNGRDEGFVAMARMWPKLGRGYFVLTNGVNNQLLVEIRRAFGEAYGLSDMPPRAERRVANVDIASFDGLTGRYVATLARDTLVLDVTSTNGVLSLYNHSSKRLMRLWPESADTFFDIHAGGTFVFEHEGASGSGAPGRAKAIRLGRAQDAPRAVRQ